MHIKLLLLIDVGCEVEGYAADITRTFPVDGKFSQAQRQIYQIVLEAQLAAIACNDCFYCLLYIHFIKFSMSSISFTSALVKTLLPFIVAV
jgi:hypothetical protein